jgi:BirA family biotin operon repressor/biotin-[acetyl-CoA-carboxylase] ligase
MVVPLAVELVQPRLRNSLIGHRILSFDSVTSTMDVARREAENGALEGTVVVAECQTDARGRFGRQWISAEGGSLSLSVVLYPSIGKLQRLSIATSVAVLRSIHRVTGLSPTLKWPNDVRLSGKKTCGILVEAVIRGEVDGFAIVGVGINVNIQLTLYPAISSIATSLSHELGVTVSREDLLVAFLEELGGIYSHPLPWTNVQREWVDALDTLGKQVKVLWGESVEEGFAEGVDSEGNLLLRRNDGTKVALPGGEVTLQV